MANIYYGTNEDGSGFLGSCELQEASVRQSLEVESNRCLGENGEKVEERRSGEVGGAGRPMLGRPAHFYGQNGGAGEDMVASPSAFCCVKIKFSDHF